MRIALYFRIASEEQMEKTNELVAECKTLIEDAGSVLVGTYIDVDGVAGRCQRDRMIADCRQRKIDVVYTKSPSKLARNVMQLLEVRRQLIANGVRVICDNALDPLKYTDGFLPGTMQGLAKPSSSERLIASIDDMVSYMKSISPENIVRAASPDLQVMTIRLADKEVSVRLGRETMQIMCNALLNLRDEVFPYDIYYG